MEERGLQDTGNAGVKEYTYAKGIGNENFLKLFRRFWSNVIESPHGISCWNWKGQLNKNGYGEFKVGNKTLKAHRMSYMFFIGPIPDATSLVCHRCDNPKCVRPGHLFLGSHEDNMRDAKLKGRLDERTRFKG